ncbi:hypothetical protein E2562_001363 [Oryza meyeriana var. granulata]|uniref:Uncharacterized protein n=1 Tax=Oryza meyeriana var. granulata TaxID=110450 RepID=A0A6G1DCI7_9ORYZ|nr:hypothetical protein E2562_001363 [Oryza meyeriana var. granulata]
MALGRHRLGSSAQEETNVLSIYVKRKLNTLYWKQHGTTAVQIEICKDYKTILTKATAPHGLELVSPRLCYD